jgi:hypothetical protein
VCRAPLPLEMEWRSVQQQQASHLVQEEEEEEEEEEATMVMMVGKMTTPTASRRSATSCEADASRRQHLPGKGKKGTRSATCNY